MTNYYRVMLGKGHVYAQECFAGNYIGIKPYTNGSDENLANRLYEDWHDFNAWFIPVFTTLYPERTRPGAGQIGGYIWTICKGIQTGDRVLCPDGTGRYHVGEVTGDYYYAPGHELTHCRPVHWLDTSIEKARMSLALQNSATGRATVCSMAGYRDEIEQLLSGITPPVIIVNGEPVEDLYAFAMEKHLEDFLVRNWSQTELGKNYNIFTEDNELAGQQYQTDTGVIDILAIRKDKGELLVVELKRGKASDVVVGQILRYMGYVKQELAVAGQTIKGIIIALDNDDKLQYALSMIPNVEFYRYKIDFKLMKV